MISLFKTKQIYLQQNHCCESLRLLFLGQHLKWKGLEQALQIANWQSSQLMTGFLVYPYFFLLLQFYFKTLLNYQYDCFY